MHKRALRLEKRDQHSDKRDQHSDQRALHLVKKALHFDKRALYRRLKCTKEPYVPRKESVNLTNQTYIVIKESKHTIKRTNDRIFVAKDAFLRWALLQQSLVIMKSPTHSHPCCHAKTHK